MDLHSEAFRRRASASAPFPDLMNDPAYAKNVGDKGKGRELDDPDTCRICRGEGTTEEPLFYPCKCSGSIKFVHQACLVEWLSHSQKKYCELCKTPFRFTKLYDPNMPADLPAPLFVQQILIHGIRTVLTWLRLLLVAFVWLGWLPWSMRAIWRALFWLADGQWSTIELSSDVAGFGPSGTQFTSAAMLPVSISSAASQSASSPTPDQVTTSQQSASSILSFAAGEPLMLTLIKKAFSAVFIPTLSVAGATSNSSSTNMASSPLRQRHPSWLSDVKFFNSLTPYPTFNNILIDTLEGQLITLLVVIAFILVFLIREWVVQQQPLANIAEAERDAAVQLIANNRPERLPEVREAERQDPAPAPVESRRGLAIIGDTEDEPAVDTDASHDQPPEASSVDDALGRTGLALPEQSAAAPSLNTPGSGPTARREPQEELPPVGAENMRNLWARNLQSETAFNFSGVRIPEAFDSYTSTDPPGSTASRSVAETPLNDSTGHQNFTFAFPVANGNAGPSTRPVSPSRINDSRPDREVVSADGPAATEGVAPDSSSRTTLLPPTPPFATADVQKTWAEKLSDYFWADVPHPTHVEEPLNDDENPVDGGLEVEGPLIRIAPNQDPAEDPRQALPANAAFDADEGDAIEDGDDLEGILELIGMQGPIFGLLQNGVFCAVLISFTVAIAIWLPYLWGKIALVLLANPVQLFFGVPVTAVTVVADVAVDTMIGSFGYMLYCVSLVGRLVLKPLAYILPVSDHLFGSYSITNASLSVIDASGQRLRKVVGAFFMFHKSDLPMFSVLSHQALKIYEARIAGSLSTILAACKFALYEFPIQVATAGPREALSVVGGFSDLESMVLGALTTMRRTYNSLGHADLSIASITRWASFETREPASTLDYDLVVWDTKDRIIAIIMGYMLASTLGLLYLRITGLFRGAAHGQRVDGMVAEVLHQAGGVMKVILIIGIEMIVFPLYCGSLLDVALLPLFKDATLASRIQFTTSSPLTSVFVHWFVGTCYMFHFALFVSMCRKIMRSGVLYFIRDPDDPTFHPVRDVLERNIGTQLRKIAFSALVYGALVIVCLGGVVWGLYLAFDDVLPVHWSPTIPVLEFPVDLLFYNFVMPLAIRVLKPSDSLHDLYNWWFHKCARSLRLTNFFFGDRRPDEEGRHVRRSWWDTLTWKQGDIHNPVVDEEQRAQAEQEDRDVYFLRDGRFVRAPASDQVRIPKGTRVFVDVSETNERLDGAADLDDGLHGRASDMFTQVYIPPYFQLRIAAFIFLIWVFAAATGVGTTIVPLVIGRKMISASVPHMRPVNDLYAFSAGLCVVGAVAYLAFYCRQGVNVAYDRLRPYLRSPRAAITGLLNGLIYVAQLVYLFSTVSVVLPSILALLTELYVFIPLDTYFNDGEAHVIHFVQDWTLGVLYVQMAVKFTLWNSQSRPAAALKAITRDGWFSPNVRLATRAFILPFALFATLAAIAPLCIGFLLTSTAFRSSPSQIQSQVYRYSYPVVFLTGLTYWVTYLIRRRLDVLRVNIRDEVYLIGERLHNLSEKRAEEVGVSRRVITG